MLLIRNKETEDCITTDCAEHHH